MSRPEKILCDACAKFSTKQHLQSQKIALDIATAEMLRFFSEVQEAAKEEVQIDQARAQIVLDCVHRVPCLKCCS